jgi:hypothetical protein
MTVTNIAVVCHGVVTPVDLSPDADADADAVAGMASMGATGTFINGHQ